MDGRAHRAGTAAGVRGPADRRCGQPADAHAPARLTGARLATRARRPAVHGRSDAADTQRALVRPQCERTLRADRRRGRADDDPGRSDLAAGAQTAGVFDRRGRDGATRRSVPTAGAVSDDGRVAVADLGDRFIVWDTATGRELPAPRAAGAPAGDSQPRRAADRGLCPRIARSLTRLARGLSCGCSMPARGSVCEICRRRAAWSSGAFARDGRFVTVGYDLRVRLWSSDGQLLHVLSSGDQMSAAAFDPTGRYLAAAGKLGVHVWDARSGAPIATLPLASGVPNDPAERRRPPTRGGRLVGPDRSCWRTRTGSCGRLSASSAGRSPSWWLSPKPSCRDS